MKKTQGLRCHQSPTAGSGDQLDRAETTWLGELLHSLGRYRGL